MPDNSQESLGEKLDEFVQEDNGGFSATRLALLLWAGGVFVVWAYESLRKGDILALNGDVATILGILMSGKVVQKFGEKPAADDPAKPAAGQGA